MEKFENAWNQLRESIAQWLADLNWLQIFGGLAVIAVVVALRKILTRFAIKLLVFIGKSIGVEINETVQTTVKPAAQALIVSLAIYIGMEIVNPPEIISKAAEKILISVAIAAIFAAIYSLTDPLAVLLRPYRTSRTQIQVDWVVRLAKIAAVLLGIAAVLKVWGIDLGPALTGMGVFGAAVALAAQDLFKNLIAGMTNVSERRFNVGDWIRVEGVIEGIVERVEFRSTLIKRFDMAPVHVPNADLANATLTNYSRMPHRRIYWKVGVVYSTTTEQLASIRNTIEKFITESEDFVPATDASCFVRVDSFNDSCIDMLVYCFTQSATYSDFLEVKERLVLQIKEAVESAGSSFAFPSRSIYLEAHSAAGPDRFVTGPQDVEADPGPG